jgi:hypothetical protein
LSDQSSPVDYLHDVHEIQQVLLKYPIALDTQCFGLFDEVFAADARIALGGMGTLDRDGYRRVCADVLPTLDATQHHVGSPVLTIEGATARSRCYFVAQHARNDLQPGSLLVIGGWYDDELEKVGGRWLITARVGTPVWWDGNPAVLGRDGVPGAEKRRPGRSCPTWLWST